MKLSMKKQSFTLIWYNFIPYITATILMKYIFIFQQITKISLNG